MGDTAEERGRGRGRTSSSRSSSSSCRCSSGLAADIARSGCHQLGKESRRTPRAWGLLSTAEAGAGQCWPSVGTRRVVDSRVGGLCAGITVEICTSEKKKVYNTKAQNEGLKRSLRREGWIPCDVGVSCSMIGSPQSPDGMAGLVLQKRHRPWSDQGSEGSPKTPGPLPGPFLFSPGPSPDLLSLCLHPVQLFRLFSLPQSIGIAMPDSAVDDASHFCSFMDPRPRRSRLDLIHPSLEEARNHLTVARLKCHLGWHLFGFSSWKRWPLFVRARPDHHPSPS